MLLKHFCNECRVAVTVKSLPHEASRCSHICRDLIKLMAKRHLAITFQATAFAIFLLMCSRCCRQNCLQTVELEYCNGNSRNLCLTQLLYLLNLAGSYPRTYCFYSFFNEVFFFSFSVKVFLLLKSKSQFPALWRQRGLFFLLVWRARGEDRGQRKILFCHENYKEDISKVRGWDGGLPPGFRAWVEFSRNRCEAPCNSEAEFVGGVNFSLRLPRMILVPNNLPLRKLLLLFRNSLFQIWATAELAEVNYHISPRV